MVSFVSFSISFLLKIIEHLSRASAMRRCVFYVRLLSLLLSFLRCCFSPFTTAKTSPRYFQVDFLQTRGCTFKAVTLQRLETFRSVLFRFVSFRFISFRFISFRFVSFRFVSTKATVGGGTPIFSTGFSSLARVTLYLTDKNTLGRFLGAA